MWGGLPYFRPPLRGGGGSPSPFGRWRDGGGRQPVPAVRSPSTTLLRRGCAGRSPSPRCGEVCHISDPRSGGEVARRARLGDGEMVGEDSRFRPLGALPPPCFAEAAQGGPPPHDVGRSAIFQTPAQGGRWLAEPVWAMARWWGKTAGSGR